MAYQHLSWVLVRRKVNIEAEAGLRALCQEWRSWRGFRLPTHRWACSPPLRSTSIPFSVPLTEASAQLSDNALSQLVKGVPPMVSQDYDDGRVACPSSIVVRSRNLRRSSGFELLRMIFSNGLR